MARHSGNRSSLRTSQFQVRNAWSCGPLHVTISGFWARTSLLLGALTVRFFLVGFVTISPSSSAASRIAPEGDVDFVHGVGGQGLAVAAVVAPARLLQLAVVRRDSGGGELVDADVTEGGGDVVADDLPLAGDRGRLQPEAAGPLVGVGGDGGHRALELLVLRLLLQRAGQRCLCFVEVLEPAAGDAGLAAGRNSNPGSCSPHPTSARRWRDGPGAANPDDKALEEASGERARGRWARQWSRFAVRVSRPLESAERGRVAARRVAVRGPFVAD